MDALALLCTLHADGPSTLKNLRQAGCGSLEAIESMEEERLSQVLGAPPAVARRFVREARHLRERLEPGVLDREEAHVDAPSETLGLSADSGTASSIETTEVFDLAARLGLSNVVPTVETRGERTPSVPVESVDGASPTAMSGAIGSDPSAAPSDALRDPMAEVLEAWRTRDEVEASAQEASAQIVLPPVERMESTEEDVPPRPVRARPEFEFGVEIVAAMRELTSTITPGRSDPAATGHDSVEPAPADSPLVEGLSALMEGQGPELARRLGEEGICDLRDLTDEDVLALSERFGFGYTRILRLVQLARRAAVQPLEAPTSAACGVGVLPTDAVADAPDALSQVDSTAKLSPADRPRSTRPSILELEWNLEIQPQAPPREHALPESTIPEIRREGAGGPFA